MKSLLKNWSLLAVANVVQQLMLFLGFIKIARVLGPELFGKFSILISSTSIAFSIATLGVYQIVTREVARDKNILKKQIPFVFLIVIVFTFFIGLFLIVYLYNNENITEQLQLFLVFILLISMVVWSLAESVAFGLQIMKFSAFINIISFTLFFIIIFLFPVIKLGFSQVLWIYVGTFFTRALIYFFLEIRKKFISFNITFNKKDFLIKPFFSKTIPLYGTNLLTIPVIYLPILFLGHNSGQSEVGYFTISTKLSLPISLIITNLTLAIYPKLSKIFIESPEDFRKKVKLIFSLVTFGGAICSIILGLLGKEIIDIIFGAKYFQAVQTFSIQIWVVLNISVHTVIGTIFLSTDKEKTLVKLSFINAIIIGSVSYIGSFYNSKGLAMGFWISYLIGFIIHLFYIVKKIEIKFEWNFYIKLFTIYIIGTFLTYSFYNISLLFRVLLLIVISLVILFVGKSYFINGVKYLRKKEFV